MNVYDLITLERLEQIPCPPCRGTGVSTTTWSLRGDDGQFFPVRSVDTCEICNGERCVWRLRLIEDTGPDLRVVS